MNIFLLTVLLTVVTASAREILSEYHQKVGIPLAKHIKATEDVLIRKRRVVGGDPVAITAHPYLAGLIISLYGTSDTSVCSASLLNQQLLVSAAHCNYNGKRTVRGYTVVLGSSMLYSGGLRIKTSRVSVHPDFDLDLLLNDILIIHLPSKISYTKYIRPVSLPSARDKSKKFVGYAATVAGYGDIDENQDNSNPYSEANEVKLSVISNRICSHHYGGIIRMTELCTSGKGRIGTCYGDSGGPLVIKKHGKDILIGVVSFTHIDGCERGKPTGFSRVTTYLDFLQEAMESSERTRDDYDYFDQFNYWQ